MAWDCVFLILNGELWRKDKWTRALTLSSKLQMQTHRKVKTQLETGLSFQTKEPSSFLVVKLAAVPALLNIYPVYSDDNAMVSKNTDVIVKRMPAMRGMGILSRMKNQDSGNAMISSSNLSVPYLYLFAHESLICRCPTTSAALCKAFCLLRIIRALHCTSIAFNFLREAKSSVVSAHSSMMLCFWSQPYVMCNSEPNFKLFLLSSPQST